MSDEQAQAIQTGGADLIVLLNGIAKAVTLYEPNNTAVVRQMDLIQDRLGRLTSITGEGVRLQILAEEFFINGRLLKMDAQLYERATLLAKTLSRFHIGEVRFEKELNRADLEAFVAAFAKAARGSSPQFPCEEFGTLHLGRAKGGSVASFRVEPRKLASLLYGSLLDLAESLYEAAEVGQTPSLLPIKRAMQLVIDAMVEHGGIFQVLAAIRDPNRPLTPVRLRVAAAVDAIGYGHYLGLPKTDLLYLGLGGIMGGLSPSTDPDEAVAPLFRFAGLGDAATPLILAVHDARSARLGRSAGVAGRMLSVAEVYQELITASSKRSAISPHKALLALASGRIPGIDKAAAMGFLDYKGQYPLGSVIRLDDGSLGVVVAQTDADDGKLLPLVAILGPDGIPGEMIDLRLARDRKILSAPDPNEVGFNIAVT